MALGADPAAGGDSAEATDASAPHPAADAPGFQQRLQLAHDDAARRMQELKSRMRELLAEAVAHEGAKVTAKQARRELDLAIGEASIYQIFGSKLDGKGAWSTDTHAETLRSMAIIERLKVTAHNRRYSGAGQSMRDELGQQQQIAANQRIRMWAAEECLELIDPISERALPGTSNELRIAAEIEFNAADDAVNAAQFHLTTHLDKSLGEIHHRESNDAKAQLAMQTQIAEKEKAVLEDIIKQGVYAEGETVEDTSALRNDFNFSDRSVQTIIHARKEVETEPEPPKEIRC